eukprot:TRINITY_DN3207_c0_g1_i1.p1 TRINITY_DN3207_c0_g1~~TRINITY_DN3207_c0_g1_i1.p1  ORF type:complete len:124 (-),score=24.15 TRINITY_DN3207_c0_g1_i1:315-686(-)
MAYYDIATSFVTYYYNVFDSNRSALAELYKPEAVLTFEGDQFDGVDAIVDKLLNLQFEHVTHEVTTMDVQPVPMLNGMIIHVTGNLSVDGQDYPLKFSQSFCLTQMEDQSFYVTNDIFRLNYG